ncbi:hypothetical protein DWX59_05735 [Enterocloster aldenensis]|nr:hypothetical protein DWX59_05735 [Enterocloster aldenensis]
MRPESGSGQQESRNRLLLAVMIVRHPSPQYPDRRPALKAEYVPVCAGRSKHGWRVPDDGIYAAQYRHICKRGKQTRWYHRCYIQTCPF